MKKINVTAVSYLNTKPFLFGLISKNWDSNLNIKLDIPSACARKLSEGKADIGLIPVAALLDNPELKVISSYCIGSDGPVRTVAIFADQLPLKGRLFNYLSELWCLYSLRSFYWEILAD